MQFLADVSLLCPVCRGKRFGAEVLAVHVNGKHIADVLEMSVEEAIAWAPARRDLHAALQPLRDLGLAYLRLGQPLSTLSGGEAQRLKLARALTEKTDRTLFILDEPSAGLHPSDTKTLLIALHALIDRGASVLVIDHELDIVRASDWIMTWSGAGTRGGELCSRTRDLSKSDTRTGDLCAMVHHGPRPSAVRQDPIQAIAIENAREHNLRDITHTVRTTLSWW
jgi:excinuclease ABC subunit A